MKRRVIVSTGMLLAMLQLAVGQERGGNVPPVTPLAETAWSEDVRALAQEYAELGRLWNDLRTLLRHPEAVRGIMPFARYLQQTSTLPARDRELLWLRASWLARSEYLWARHVGAATAAGLSPGEIRGIGAGAADPVWRPFDAALLRAADELYRDAAIHDATWRILTTRYGAEPLLDAVLTVAEGIMLSTMWNSLGVPLDADLEAHFPSDIARTIGPAGPTPLRLERPRLAPLDEAQWTDEVRALLDPNRTGREVLNLYKTLAHHPAMYRPRAIQSAYIRTRSRLDDRARELLILRIGWLCGAEYEWAQHVRAGRSAGITDEEIRRIAQGPDAPGWDPFDATLLRATDELHRDDRIGDATWQALAARYDAQELIDVLITVGGYRMVSVVLNTLGTPLEPGREGFPR